MRTALAVALAVAVTLAAGCSAFGSGQSTATDRTPYAVPDRPATGTTPTGTATPTTADTPAGTPIGWTAVDGNGSDGGKSGQGDGEPAVATPGPTTDRDPIRIDAGEVAPGVTEQLVSSPSRLVAAHHRVLANRSFRVRLVRTVRSPDGTHRTTRVDARVGPDGRAVVGREVVGPSGSLTRGVVVVDGQERRRIDGSMSAARVVPAALDYRRLVRRGIGATTAVEVRAVPGHVAPAVYRIDSVATDGDRFVRRLDGEWDRGGRGAVANLRVGAVVDSRGLVRNLSVSYALVRDDRRIRVHTRIQFSGVGTTTVDLPGNASATRPGTRSAPRGRDPPGGRGESARNPPGDERSYRRSA